MEKTEALRYNENKNRLDLVDPILIEEVAKVMTFGAKKYTPNNWRKGMAWSKCIASLKRHVSEFEKGNNFDEESGISHLAHIGCNIMFLLDYCKHHPELDDRQHKYLKVPKIGLDIDGVLADFNGAYSEKFCPNGIDSWNCHFDTGDHLKELTQDDKFYMSLKPLCNPKDIPFEPHCYITSRSIPQEWTEKWLFENGFPTCKVYSIPFGASKAEIARQSGIDIFVDDRYENFRELNNAGICTFLFDASHNQRYDVGYKRLYSLKDLVM